MRLEPYDSGHCPRSRGDGRRGCLPNDAMDRSGLTSGTDRLVVDVMRRRAAGIDVGRVAQPGPSFSKSRKGERELRQERQHGGSSAEGRKAATKGRRHRQVAYADGAKFASQRLRTTSRWGCLGFLAQRGGTKGIKRRERRGRGEAWYQLVERMTDAGESITPASTAPSFSRKR